MAPKISTKNQFFYIIGTRMYVYVYVYVCVYICIYIYTPRTPNPEPESPKPEARLISNESTHSYRTLTYSPSHSPESRCDHIPIA